MGTKEKILLASLNLFNELGERHVTTNHIAAHLNISPGNLYYHYRNKQAIVSALFEEYEAEVLEALKLPTDRALALQDKLDYLLRIFKGLWDYRFLHRDMEHLLTVDPQLHRQYQQFFRVCIRQIEAIFDGLCESGILQMSAVEVSALALNTWIVVTSWFSFLRCTLAGENAQGISPEMVKGGIHQIILLERPYLTEQYREPMQKLQRGFEFNLSDYLK